MPGNQKKLLIISSFTVKIGCGSCRRSRRLLSNIFHPKPKHSNKISTSYSSSTTTLSPATLYSDDNDTDSDIKSLRVVKGFGRIGGESLAVEKDSDDPYLDFRHSMLQMILENEVYSKEELKELLNCFLQLNSPYHHGIIVRAFTEIWNGVYSVKSGSSSKMHGVYKSRDL